MGNAPTPQDRISLARQRADIERIRELEPLVDQLRGELKSLKDSVKARLEAVGASTGTIGKEVVATLTTTTRQSFDQKTFQSEQPEMHRKYVRTIPVQSFRVTAGPES